MMHGYNEGYGMMRGFGILNFGYGSLIMIVIVLIIVYAIYKLFSDSHSMNFEDHSLDVLKSRFVQGEISEEEYISIKKILQRK